jgi:hypothetical protein
VRLDPRRILSAVLDRRTLGFGLAFVASLSALHGALPFPYLGEVAAELCAAFALALVQYASAEGTDGRLRPDWLALVCAPALLAGMLEPAQRSSVVMLGFVLLAVARPRFWSGEERAASPAFRAGLLAVVVLQGLHVVRIGASAETSYDADAFYYFGLARHWVVSGRVEDHMLWHFLAPPEHVVHPIGDYWQPMTSLVIAPWMWLFGATHAVAGAAVAGFSLVGSVALWHLLTGRALVRHRAVQAAMLVAYGCNAQLERFRIDAETQSIVSTFLILAFVAMSHRRWLVAIGLATCVALTRTDASVSAAVVVLGCMLAAGREERARTFAFVAGVGALYVASHLVRFGTFGPPAASRAPLLATYQDLYRYHPTLLTSSERLSAVLTALPLSPMASAAVLLQHPFVLAPGAGLFGSYAAWGAWARDAEVDVSRRATLGVAIVISLFVPMILVAIAGPVFNEGRTYQGLIGPMHFVVAYAADRVLRVRRMPDALASILGLALLGYVLSHATLAQERTSQRIEVSQELRTISAELEGHVVLTELSWWVGAETNAAGVIHTPITAEAEVIEVIDRWGPDLFLAEPASCPGSLARVIPGSSFVEAQLGPHRLVPLHRGTWYRLYRIERAAD